MMTQDAVRAGCTEHDAERYAQARQTGREPWQAISTLPTTLRMKVFCGSYLLQSLVLTHGLLETLNIVNRNIIRACIDDPDSCDELMGYEPVTDMSLYEF